MTMKMVLEIRKWRFPWPLGIFSTSVGNDFQQPRGNQEMRHFQMSSMSTPYGGRPALDVAGRSKIYEAIVKGEADFDPGLPESFNVLVRELQSLCLDVELVQKKSDADEPIAEPLITSGI